MRTTRGGAALLALAACAALATGCASTSKASGPPATTTTTTTTTVAHGTQALLAALDVSQADVPKGYSVALVPASGQLAGVPNWGVCIGSYPSESTLQARRWVAVIQSGTQQSPVFGTEADVYSNANGPTQALSEFVHSVSTCPTGYVTSAFSSDEPAKWRFPTPPETQAVPGLNATVVLAQVDIELKQGVSTQLIEAFLREGNVLLWLDFSNPPLPQAAVAVDGSSTVVTIIEDFARRLFTTVGS